MPSSSVILRLGSHAEKDYLLKTASLYQGVIVGANLLEMTPGATTSLSWKFSTLNRPFGLDPLTYVFALDQTYITSEKRDKRSGTITIEMKKSFQKICQEYGDPFKSVCLQGRRPLTPQDFGDQSSISNLARCVLMYQLERMNSICQADPQLAELSGQTKPSFVFSPYFYIPGDPEALSRQWEALCLTALSEFGALESPVPKHGVICFSRRLLKDTDRLLSLVQQAIRSGCDATWFWVSDFREEDITPTELRNLSLMVKAASQIDHPIYNLHGGFLSSLLSKQGLHGFSHSIGYGESKDVFPVSGGALPTVAYHYNPLHVKSSVPDIERAFSTLGITDAAAFHKNVCDCSICLGTIKGNIRNFRKFGELSLKPGNTRESQTAESAKRCRFHFLLARRKEVDFVNKYAVEDLNGLLKKVVDEYEALPYSIKLRERSYPLKNWLALFT